MSSELPFRLPVRRSSSIGEIKDADGIVVARTPGATNADAIVAALNGYAAMREALENMPRPSSTGDMTEFGRRVLHWQASVDALAGIAEVKP